MMRQEEHNEDRLKDIVMVMSVIGFLTAFIFIIGTAGGLETDSIDMPSYIRRIVICLVLLILSVRGICWSEKDDDEYGNL